MNNSPIRTVLWGQWCKVRALFLVVHLGIALIYLLLGILDARDLRPNAGDPGRLRSLQYPAGISNGPPGPASR